MPCEFLGAVPLHELERTSAALLGLLDQDASSRSYLARPFEEVGSPDQQGLVAVGWHVWLDPSRKSCAVEAAAPAGNQGGGAREPPPPSTPQASALSPPTPALAERLLVQGEIAPPATLHPPRRAFFQPVRERHQRSRG